MGQVPKYKGSEGWEDFYTVVIDDVWYKLTLSVYYCLKWAQKNPWGKIS